RRPVSGSQPVFRRRERRARRARARGRGPPVGARRGRTMREPVARRIRSAYAPGRGPARRARAWAARRQSLGGAGGAGAPPGGAPAGGSPPGAAGPARQYYYPSMMINIKRGGGLSSARTVATLSVVRTAQATPAPRNTGPSRRAGGLRAERGVREYRSRSSAR